MATVPDARVQNRQADGSTCSSLSAQLFLTASLLLYLAMAQEQQGDVVAQEEEEEPDPFVAAKQMMEKIK
eukprot:17802-Eustigmatos_ZCMA.PRE.1